MKTKTENIKISLNYDLTAKQRLEAIEDYSTFCYSNNISEEYLSSYVLYKKHLEGKNGR